MDDSENGGRDAGTVAYDLRKEKRIRGGQRGATTRLLKRGAELLAGDVVDAVEVEHVKTSLQGKVTVLKALDEAILNGMGEDEDIEREIDDADRLQCDVLLCIAKLKAAVVQSNVEESQSAAVPVPVVLSPVLAAAPTASSSSHSVTRATNESLAEDSTHQSVSTPEGYSTPQLEVQLQLTGDRNESKAVSGTRLADPLELQANPDSAQVPREPIDECTIHAIREGLSEAHEKAGSPGIMVSSAPMTRSMSVASNHEEAMSYNLRLPKLKLRSYDGNLAEWTTFWDMFTTSVHNNPKIATIDKFSYLKSVLDDWDEPLPETRVAEWNAITEDLQNCKVSVPRCYHPDPAATWSLHGFCDASTKAYAAVVYLVKRNGDGIHTRFVAAKTRVAPLKEVSIPRLELLAAVILARLITTVRLALEGQLKIDDMVCWSDSLVALYWITNPGHKEWKQFVSNRVNGIHGLVPGMKWRYCPTDQNPADVASRGTSCMNLMADERWLNGPTAFLAEWSNSDCPDNSVEDPPAICLEEEKSKKKEQQPKPVTVSAATVNSPAEDIGNVIDSNVFGTYTRLIRVTATMLLAIDRMKKRSDSKTPMTAHLRRAEELWILAAQKSIKSDAKLTKTVKQLDVREEESGVLRCGGRLQNALISEGAKYPILLPTEHHVTNLIIMDCHQRMMHGGSKATLAEVREKFWIVRGRQVVKKLIGRCVICRRHEGKPLRGPLAPPLPPFRIQQAPAFQNIGLDNAGPLFVNGSEKVWILLFTCCVTRAIHLELVESLSTDAFLRAMRRFTARRGVPSFIVSDNAQTFKAASKFLNRVGQQTIQRSFNLPRAPWWGGVFERLIRSVKRCLRKVVGGGRLTRDELNTVVTEVEMVINARPLYVGMTSDDMEPPLTPSHLLHGRRISQMAEEPVEAADDPDFSIPESNTATLDKRMKHMKMVMHHFWSRWQKEYVLELRTACKNSSKFSKYPSDVSKGDVVIIYDKEQPRGSWKTGVVERLHEGADGKCRGADVRVINSQGKAVTFQRAVQHLYPLELSCNEPENEQEKPEDPKEIEQQPTRQSRAAAKAARSSVKQLKELGLV